MEIRCLDPQRRDALEESARLVLAFVSACSRPGRRLQRPNEDLRLTLSSAALQDGCYLPESAQRLLEAVSAFGVEIRRREREGDEDPTQEWLEWWSGLSPADDKTFDLVLEIV